jgi:hypothetical protein
MVYLEKEYKMKLLLVIICLGLLSGCNAFIGIPTDLDTQPWRTLYLISFFSLLFLPVLSIATLVFSIWQSPEFKLKLEKYLYKSLLVFGGLWLLTELSLPSNTNIRVDLFFIIPALLMQLVAVFIAILMANKIDNDNKPISN